MLKVVLAAATLSLSMAAHGLAADYHEAPALNAQVQAGKLPPVAERLPSQPEVVTPVDRVGRYGGVLRSALRGDSDHNAILKMVGNQGLTRWNLDYTDIKPNLATGWTTNEDASEYTFKLRPGTKWSDGQAFGADDILFFVNDLLSDPQFFASAPSQYVIGGERMRAEKVDDNTVKIIFAGPYLNFPRVLASPLGQHAVLYAKHYCAQFVPKYNPNIADLLKQSGQPDWPTLLRQKCGDIEIPARWGNPARPTLDPWVIATPYSGNATQVVLRRNPYFWEVDTAGNQLPYLDAINFKVISDIQSIVLAAIGGQLDLQVRHINTISNKPVLSLNAASGGYALEPTTSTDATAEALYINQTNKNPKLRALLTNRDFRTALSLAMNRDEINEIVFLGQSKPWQVGPYARDPFYNERLGTQYTVRDLEKANVILDGLGLKRDASGFRQYPDGSGRVFLSADVMVVDPASIDTIQLVKKHWAEVGIDLGINTVERSLFYAHAQNNDYDIGVMPAPGGVDPTSDPRAWISTSTIDSRQSIPWVRWAESGGKAGEAPSESMQKRLKLWAKWKGASSPEQASATFKQILAEAADAFEVLGTVQGLTTFGIRNAKLANVVKEMPNAWIFADPGPTLPQQYFFVQ